MADEDADLELDEEYDMTVFARLLAEINMRLISEMPLNG